MNVAPLDGPGVRFAIPASPSGRDLQAPLPPGPSNISPARWGKLLVQVGPNESIERGHAGLAKSPRHWSQTSDPPMQAAAPLFNVGIHIIAIRPQATD